MSLCLYVSFLVHLRLFASCRVLSLQPSFVCGAHAMPFASWRVLQPSFVCGAHAKFVRTIVCFQRHHDQASGTCKLSCTCKGADAILCFLFNIIQYIFVYISLYCICIQLYSIYIIMPPRYPYIRAGRGPGRGFVPWFIDIS